jgi:Na+/citrate or Na+/malate symporter
VQVGAGSTTTTGYTTVGVGFASTPTYSLAAATTTGFIFQDGMAAFVVVSGAMYISSFGSNLWVSNAVVNRGTNGATSYAGFGAGNVTLSGTLDRVRLTTVNGTDTFDAGSVNILYE